MKIKLNDKEIKIKDSDYSFAESLANSTLNSIKRICDTKGRGVIYYLVVIALYRYTTFILNNIDEDDAQAIIDEWDK